MSGAPPTIFVSYSHEDEAWKDRLLKQLEVFELEGEIDVWDDRRIRAGEDWKESIADTIQRAEAAILMVSADFLSSPFIREEEVPQILKRRHDEGLLTIPVIVKPCPWERIEWLRGMQARPVDGRPLSGGSDHEIDNALASLAIEVRDLLKGSGAAAGAAGPTVAPHSRGGSPAWLLPLLPTLVFLPLVLLSTVWRLDTRMQLDLVARRLAFTVGGDESQEILGALPGFQALTIESCEAVAFSAEKLEVAEPRSTGGATQGEGRPGLVPAWRELEPGKATFLCADPSSKIAVGPADRGRRRTGTLDRIHLAPGADVAIAVSDETPPEITIDVGSKQELAIAIHEDVEFTTDLVDLEGQAVPAAVGDLVTYRAQLSPAASLLQVRSRPLGLVLVVSPPVGEPVGEFFQEAGNIPLTSVTLLDESVDGTPQSPLLGEGTLTYPDYPSVSPVTVDRGEFVALGGLARFRLKKLQVLQDIVIDATTDERTHGLAVRLDGIVQQVRSGDPEFQADHRLTLFDTLRYSWRWSFAIAASWILLTTGFAHARWKRSNA